MKKLLVSLFVALATVSALAGAPANTARAHYKIGLQLYTVRDACEKDFPGTLKAVAAAGFSGVEFAGYWGLSLIHI